MKAISIVSILVVSFSILLVCRLTSTSLMPPSWTEQAAVVISYIPPMIALALVSATMFLCVLAGRVVIEMPKQDETITGS